MAKIEASVKTPAVPATLEVLFPGKVRPSRLPLSAFSDEELQQVGADWTAALIEKAKVPDAPKAPRKPRVPKAE